MSELNKTLISNLIATAAILGSVIILPTGAHAITNDPITQQSKQLNGRYAVHLASVTDRVKAEKMVQTLRQQGHISYSAEAIVKGVTWHRIRVGFFNDKQSASRSTAPLKKRFPKLWVTKVAKSEKKSVLQSTVAATQTVAQTEKRAPFSTLRAQPVQVASQGKIPAIPLVAATAAPAAAPKVLPETPVASTAEDKTLKQLMDQAEQSMIALEYDRAIQLYAKVLREPENKYSKQALEFTGVARERKGQNARAKAAYEQYLEQYPEGEDAVRIRQRITALITATETPKSRTSTAARPERSRWDVYGGFSQFYRRDESTTEQEDFKDTSVNRSALSNDLYLTGRYRGEEYDLRTRFAGGYEEDFLDSEESELRISTIYLDLQDKQASNTLRIGRQSSSTGGVLGRFDGAIVGHSFSETLKLNLVAGYPVDTSTYEKINTDRYFYGVNADLGTYADAWDFNLFFIEQYNADVLDRRAIGAEARYFQPGRTLFTLLDYDISYNDLNTLFLLGSWTNEAEQTFNLSVDYRNSPTLTTTNGIQSQSVDTLEELLATGATEDEIRQYAQDRTIRSFNTTIGMVQPITDNFQLSGDLTISKLDDSIASGGVEAIPGTDYEYSLFIQAIGTDLLKKNDLGIVGLRFTDATNSRRYGLTLNSRYPVTDTFRINPRIQTEYRQNTDDNTDQWFVRPSLRMEYKWRRKTRFELEIGGEISNRELTNDTSETTSYFISLGYRHDF